MRGMADGGSRQVDADAIDRAFRCERREQVAAAASEVDNAGALGRVECMYSCDHGVRERPTQAGCPETCARGDSLGRIAGVSRAPVLRLEQIDVAGAGHVERVPSLAGQRPAELCQRFTTFPNRAR